MHEHIFIDFSVPDDEPHRWRIAGRTKPVEWEALRIYEAPLTMDILSAVQYGAARRNSTVRSDREIRDPHAHTRTRRRRSKNHHRADQGRLHEPTPALPGHLRQNQPQHLRRYWLRLHPRAPRPLSEAPRRLRRRNA